MGKRGAAETFEEEAFPRGKPERETSVAAAAPASDGAPQQKRPKLGKKGKKAKDKAEEVDEETAAAIAQVEATQSLKSAPRLRHQDIVAGSLLLGAVREVSDDELILNLPFNLVGYCGANQAVEKPPQGFEGASPKLHERYELGQLVVAVVTAVLEVGQSKRQRIEVSLRPALLNAGLSAEAVVQNMWLPAAVVDEEEHVYRLGFGVEGLQGLLKKADAPSSPSKPCVGAIVQVAVASVNRDAGIVRCTTSPGPALPSDALGMESLKAGFLVRARVDKILTHAGSAGSFKRDKKEKGGSSEDGNAGLVVKFCGALDAVIHWHHQGRGVDAAPEVKYKQHLAARVLAVVPGRQVSVHLTLLPSILDWTSQKEDLSRVAVGERLDGKVLDSLPKYGVRLRIARQGGGKAMLGFCPVARLADKENAKEAEPPAPGVAFTCRVMGYNFLEASLVVTRRPYDLREDTLVSVAEMAPGQLVTGEIARIAEFGVFVKISEYVSGLVHLRHLTDVPLASVPKKFQVGAKAKCRVLRVFPEKRQVSLTMKKTMVRSDFQLGTFEKARKDMLLTGFVSSVKPYGAIVSFYGDTYGLIPAKEMDQEEAPALGMSVQVRVENIHHQRKRMGLSLNLDGGKPAAELADALPARRPGTSPGSLVTAARLLEANDLGAVVGFTAEGVDSEMRGFVPAAHLADDGEWATERLRLLRESLGDGGEESSVALDERGVVLAPRFKPKVGEAELAPAVLLSLKPSLRLAAEEGAFVTDASQLEPLQLCTGYVKEVRDFGAVVSAGSWRTQGVALKHQLSTHFVQDPRKEVQVGQTVRMRVTEVDATNQRFNVDLRPSPVSAASAALLKREAEALRLLLGARSAAVSGGKKFPPLAPGSVLDSEVDSVQERGIVLKISGHKGLTTMVLKENVPAGQNPKVGESLRCAVLDCDPIKRTLDVSLQPELVSSSGSSSLAAAEGKKSKKRKAGSEGSGKEVAVVPVLQKSAYSVVWSKEPPAVLFMPPFGARAWPKPRSALVHGVVDGSLAQQVACCPLGGNEPNKKSDKSKVTRIENPKQELHVGSTLSMRIMSVKGLQVLCVAPVGLRGHVHATHFVDLQGKKSGGAGCGGQTPLQDLEKKGTLKVRVLSVHERGENDKGKIFHLELSCRPSLVESEHDAAAYEASLVRWPSLAQGQLVQAAVSEVRKSSMWLEVAPGIRGKVSLLDASPDLKVVRALGEHFKVGQVFQARVLRAAAASRKLDLALHGGGAGLKEGQKVLARLENIEEIHGNGIAASFRLPGRQRGVVHVTELFDFWARFPLKRLKVGNIYEAVLLGSEDSESRLELSLRASAVHGQKEGPEEARPTAAADVRVGQQVSGYVVNSGPKGVFVALSRLLTARIRLKALSDRLVAKDSVARMHPVGELIQSAVVTEVDLEQGRVELSLRKGAGAGGGSLSLEQLSVGDVVGGRIKKVEKYGMFLRIDNSSLDALVHRSEISDTASTSLDSFEVGSLIKRAKVLRIEDGKIWLGIKPSLFTEDELKDDDDEDDAFGLVDDDEERFQPQAAGVEVDGEGGGEEAANVFLSFTGDGPAASSGKGKKKRKEEVPDDSDEEAPWETAAAARGGAGGGVGFDWAELDKAEGDEAAELEDEDSDLDGARPTKRQKKALKKAEARELAKKEADNAQGGEPKSVEDFEKLLLTQGDTSVVWIQYMAFHLKTSDLQRARQVAERAVKHVGFSDAKERFNAWVAFMNLECTFGTDDSAQAVFTRAASHNEAKHVYLQYAKIHQRNKKPGLATKAYDVCSKKYPQSKKVWIAFLTFLFEEDDAEGARKTLPRALAALPKRKHPIVVSKAGMLEYQKGSAERGRSIFEGLLDSYPSRTDLWSVYLDAHIAAHTPPRAPKADLEQVRDLMERCCALKLKAMKMRFFFKRYLDFEKKWGDAESQEKVRTMAREFVESQAQ